MAIQDGFDQAMVAEPAVAASLTKSAKKRSRQARVRARNEKMEADSRTTAGDGKEFSELGEFEVDGWTLAAVDEAGAEPGTSKADHFCGKCAAAYGGAEPGMCKANDITGDGSGAGKAESLSEWDKKEEEAEGITRRLAELAARCEAGTPSKADVQAMLLNLVERENLWRPG